MLVCGRVRQIAPQDKLRLVLLYALRYEVLLPAPKTRMPPSPTLSPTDPVPRGQLWPTGPIYSLYTAYIQPIYSLYAVYIQPIYSLSSAKCPRARGR